MSEDTNTNAVPTKVDFSTLELQRDPTANERYYEVEEGKVKIIEKQITRDKSDYKGFTYFSKQYLNLGAAIAAFGEELLLELFNAKLASQIGVRVGAKIESNIAERDEKTESVEQYNERRKKTLAELLLKTPTIFTPEDAYNYVPGDRELSMAGIVRKINKLMAAGQALMSNGKVAEGTQAFVEVGVLSAKLNEMVAKAREEAESAISGAATATAAAE